MTETSAPLTSSPRDAQGVEAGSPRLRVTRWRRFGHDRLYVAGPDDENLGYRDLSDGTDHADSPLHRAVVAHVADNWSRDVAAGPESGPPQATATPAQPLGRTWADLSGNAPGDALRAVLATTNAAETGSWEAGLRGEERVGMELRTLTAAWPAWQALHSVPVGHRDADIDHVVMGPGGVFTINTKHHQDARIHVNHHGFLVNGTSTHHVPNARHEAQRAARLLSAATGLRLHVTGLIVPVGARSVQVKAQPEGLFVIPADDLRPWLLDTGAILPVAVLAQVWEAARRSTTWEC